MAARLRSGSDQPERGRRKIARDRKIARFRDLVAENADGVIFFARGPDQKIIEHQLRVIAAEERLVDGRLALREKARQKQRTFNLRARNRQLVGGAPQFHSMNLDRRGFVRPLRDDVGAPLLPSERSHYEREVAQGRVVLGKDTFESAWAEGQAMTMEQAIAYALDEGDG